MHKSGLMISLSRGIMQLQFHMEVSQKNATAYDVMYRKAFRNVEVYIIKLYIMQH